MPPVRRTTLVHCQWLCLRSETLIFFNPSGILNYIDQEIRIFLIICYAVSVTGVKGLKRFVLVISIIEFLTPLDLIVKSLGLKCDPVDLKCRTKPYPVQVC